MIKPVEELLSIMIVIDHRFCCRVFHRCLCVVKISRQCFRVVLGQSASVLKVFRLLVKRISSLTLSFCTDRMNHRAQIFSFQSSFTVQSCFVAAWFQKPILSTRSSFHFGPTFVTLNYSSFAFDHFISIPNQRESVGKQNIHRWGRAGFSSQITSFPVLGFRVDGTRKASYCTSNKRLSDEFLVDFINNQLNDEQFYESHIDGSRQEVVKTLTELKKNKEKIGGLYQISSDELIQKQIVIEDQSMNFDEREIFRTNPSLIKLLIREDWITAKDTLKKDLPREVFRSQIQIFGKYTLEAIIFYVMGSLFGCMQETSMVRVSKLVETLDKCVRTQAEILMSRPSNTHEEVSHDKDKGDKKESQPIFGIKLIDFMLGRDFIKIESCRTERLVVRKKGKGFLKDQLFVICNFNLRFIPTICHLPMISEPLNWESKCGSKIPIMLSDITGGYLSRPSREILKRFRILTTHNPKNFNIKLNPKSYRDMFLILNELQSQGFLINSDVLKLIKENRPTLVKLGLLLSEKLVHVNLSRALGLLRECYLNDVAVKESCSLSYLLREFSKRVQRARSEDLFITLASAYEGFLFFLPAFMDFRGRIYRSGILNFHERYLSRSLILFARNNEKCGKDQGEDLACSAAFKFRKFSTLDDARRWYRLNESLMCASSESFIRFALDASEPFQFMAQVLCHQGFSSYNTLPINQDASASAYQIMSYFLLNEEIARKTNLIPHPDGEIQDFYSSLLDDLKKFMNLKFDHDKTQIVESKLDRKLVKKLFMPIVYGKTMTGMVDNIKEQYGELLSFREVFNLAKIIMEFWKEKYPDVVNLMKLINLVGWFCAAKDRAVVYSVPYFTTLQDYKEFVKEEIVIHASKGRRRITLHVPTANRDRRKTQTSICANFVHQRDAFIAIRVIDLLLKEGAPVYSVHDNFITTVSYARSVPCFYTTVFADMGNPLSIINTFLINNLVTPYKHNNKEIHFPLDDPITSDRLNELLDSIIPEDSKDLKRLEKKKRRSRVVLQPLC